MYSAQQQYGNHFNHGRRYASNWAGYLKWDTNSSPTGKPYKITKRRSKK